MSQIKNVTAQEREFEERFSSFLSMTTHDLIAPMRKLGVLTDRLLQKFENVDPELDEFTKRIHACLEEMKSIVTGCRLIAESTSENMELEEVDTRELVTDIVSEKKAIRRDPHTQIEIGDLPLIMGDKKQLSVLFRELIGNAFLFVKKEVPLTLRITAEKHGNEEDAIWEFCFEDNGIGFQPEDSEKIFHPSVRLNGKSAFPGNGLGLTLAKKIAGNHRGELIAQSLEKGSRFIVKLPQNLD